MRASEAPSVGFGFGRRGGGGEIAPVGGASKFADRWFDDGTRLFVDS
jgi:hypothetical protein